jgi:Ca2+-binding RTX toxin-like protein
MGRLASRLAPLIVVCLGLMAAATPASATRVELFEIDQQHHIALQVAGDPGESNDITVRYDAFTGEFTIVEGEGVRGPSFSFVPGDFCSYSNWNTRIALCKGKGAGVTQMGANLGDGNDSLRLDVSQQAFVTGGLGNDTITSGSGDDFISGSAGIDTLDGREGNDRLWSDGDTNDISAKDPGMLSGGPGDDFLYGTDGPETFDGGEGADEVWGYGGNDQIYGGNGNDILNGGEGDDTLAGGAGDDRLGTFLNLSPGDEPLERGNDTMDGGPGDDLLRPGAGPEADFTDNDTLSGGDGFDTVEYQRRTERVSITIDGVANDGQAGEADNVEPSVDKVIGSPGDDFLIGSPGDDTIDGAGGDDVIDGVGGNDTLEGGTVDGGSDHLIGGSGDDKLSGSAGDDLIDGQDGADDVTGGPGSDSVDGGRGDDHLAGGAGSDTLTGGAGKDLLEGGDGDDTFDGGGGNDALKGNSGNDVLRGGLGADDLSGNDGNDEVDYELTAVSVRVTLDDVANDGSPREGDNVRKDVENVLGTGGQDTVYGSSDDNTLDGGGGEDYLNGKGAGGDGYRNGKTGSDRLHGGRGRDVLFSRNGDPDEVDCGRGTDFAIVDPDDKLYGCERASVLGRERAEQGEAVIVEPAGADAQFGTPEMNRTVPLEDRIEAPVHSRFDTSGKGSRLTVTSQARKAGLQAGDFYGGVFRIDQRPSEPVTEIHLANAGSCQGAGAGQVRPSRKKKTNGAWGDVPPPKHKRSLSVARTSARAARSGGTLFRTVGIYSSATVRSRGKVVGSSRRGRKSASTDRTLWFTQNRCEGTLTRVRIGSVVVRDFRRDNTITLTAGESYLAPAPR